MIARKILDRVDEHLDASEEPPRSRLLHVLPLQIKAGSTTGMKRALRDRTNAILPPPDVISPDISANVHTPDSCHAFGRPTNPTMKPNHFVKSTSICGSSRDSLRRERRYSLAEQALSDALQRCTRERSSRELQILALEQMTAVLGARAKESRDRAAKLKISLADRTVDPDRYATLQSDRWVEERRQYVADQEFHQLSQHLASLKLKKGLPEQEGFDENPSATPLDNEARCRANLVNFFERSPTRTSFHLHHKCRPLFVDCTFSRRITMSDVSPLRLRPSAGTFQFTTKRALPMSDYGTPAVPVRRPSKPRLTSGPSKPSSLFRSTVYSSSAYPSASLTQSPTPSSRLLPCNDHIDDVTSARPSTPPLSITSTSSNGASHVSRAPSQTPKAPSGGGVATIYASTSPRSHTEILAELDKDSVRVPEYAVNLLEGFDTIHHDLTLPERDLSSKPREEAPAVAPPPSEESDTGPYSPFALPTYESGSVWSHTSLNTSSTPRSDVPTLHPLSSGSSTPSGMSTRTPPRPPVMPSRPSSLLFLMRKRKEHYSPASSMMHLEEESTRGSKRRFSLFSRK
ncbi:hypothetical protein AZE42_06602 [Rhizopogon vesiculosus]|uniref:Uncharacterized protein n=1 Tax=Rhizopogon vesiculosus TaxID=180088 RepID=A0A1J8R1K0_9AGAM|nr:hypothetical protein AZE42_06602 [Rhizopogon vesiculosus]